MRFEVCDEVKLSCWMLTCFGPYQILPVAANRSRKHPSFFHGHGRDHLSQSGLWNKVFLTKFSSGHAFVDTVRLGFRVTNENYGIRIRLGDSSCLRQDMRYRPKHPRTP